MTTDATPGAFEPRSWNGGYNAMVCFRRLLPIAGIGIAIAGLTLAVPQLLAQEIDEGIVLQPHTHSASLTVSCDLACAWTLDGKAKGQIEAGGSATIAVKPGHYVVAATTVGGPDRVQKEISPVAQRQLQVHFWLKPARDGRLREERSRRANELLRQGDYLRNQQSYEAARPLYQEACEQKSAEACYKLAQLNELGQGGTPDYPRALQLLDRACEGGFLAGCVELGDANELANYTARDYEAAARFYRRACEGGNVDGCFSLGRLSYAGHGVPVDAQRGRQLFERACAGKNPWACYWLGYNAEFAQSEPQDYLRARQFYQQACELNNLTACYRQGVLCEKGRGGLTDEAGARLWYGRACERGVPVACYSQAVLLDDGRGGDRNQTEARRLYRKACLGGVEAACRATRRQP